MEAAASRGRGPGGHRGLGRGEGASAAGARGRCSLARARRGVLLALALLALLLAGCAGTPPAKAPQGIAVRATFDRFAEGKLGGWELAGGAWSVVARADAPSPPNAASGAGANGSAGAAFPPGLVYADFEASVALWADGEAGLAFHRSDLLPYDGVGLDLAAGVLRVHTLADTGGPPATAPLPPGQAAWRALTLRVTGATTEVLVDGGPVWSGHVSDRHGGVGLWVAANSTAWFDDLALAPR